MGEPTVIHDAAAHQFEISTDEGRALLRYIQRGDVLELVHTEVPDQYEGRGFASALARAALEFARTNHLKVIPSCPFVRTYMARHTEYDDLRATP